MRAFRRPLTAERETLHETGRRLTAAYGFDTDRFDTGPERFGVPAAVGTLDHTARRPA
jgi:hypothetical protein